MEREKIRIRIFKTFENTTAQQSPYFFFSSIRSFQRAVDRNKIHFNENQFTKVKQYEGKDWTKKKTDKFVLKLIVAYKSGLSIKSKTQWLVISSQ